MSAVEQRDRRWVERIREGDEAAFEALFRSYFEELCSFAHSHVGAQWIAEDIVQNIFCDLWDRRRGWNPQGTVKAYLYRAVRNKSLDWLKHRRVRRRWEDEEKQRDRPSQEGPEDALQHTELSQALKHAVEELPERRRLVYKMVRQQGMAYADVASVLDISKKTVENQMGRALKSLREHLSVFLSVTS